MRVVFRHFSRHQLELLRDNINAQLLNDFGEYELQIDVDEPLVNPTYTASEFSCASNSHLDLDC
jgi:hypothetical protein